MNDKDALLKDYRELLTSLAWAKGKEPHPDKIARITAALEDGGWIKCSERLAQPRRSFDDIYKVQAKRIEHLERDLMLERERAEKAEADAKHYHQKYEMLLTAMYEAEEKTEAELAALRERLERQDDCVRVPRELLTLWHRVMLQNSGEYEYKCADEMAAILAAEKEPK